MQKGRRSKNAAKRRRQRRNKRIAIAAVFAVLMLVTVVSVALTRRGDAVTANAPIATASPAPTISEAVTPAPEFTPTPEPAPTEEPAPEPVQITISAVGDCTLGGDAKGQSEAAFAKAVGNDMTYCFKNVADIFAEDDLTIANLEVVLTESSKYNTDPYYEKVYYMRGKPSYAKMLPLANIDVANLANNHTNDFYDGGLDEMKGYLTNEGVAYFGYLTSYVTEIRGVTIGFLGYNTWTTKNSEIEAGIKSLRDACDILVVSFHWGSELEYNATDKQITYAHRAVDCGADLVLGHHPHVVNGIEVYKGVNIVYSLGNFCFGGKRNPKDKDTFIYQHTFTVQDGEIVANDQNIIPCKITSVSDDSYNNYQPTPVSGEKAREILKKITYYSRKFDNPLDLTAS